MLYRKIIVPAVFALHSLAFSQSRDIESVFSQFGREKDVTSINISKPMFGMLGKLSLKDADMKDLKPLLDKIKSLKILIVAQPAAKVKDAIIASAKDLNYQELMSVNNEDDQIKFLSGNAENGLLHNVLLHINSAEENVFMLLEGNMTMDDLSRFSSEVQKPDKDKAETQTTSERAVAPFHAIEAISGANVIFIQGSAQKILVDADPDVQQTVETEVQNGILEIRVNHANRKNRKNSDKIKIYVTAPDINMITVDSGSIFSTQTMLKTNDLVVKIDSGSSMKGRYEVKNMAVSMNSGSSMKIDVATKNFSLREDSGSAATVVGVAENSSIMLDSGSACNMLDFYAQTVAAKLDSGSSARISVSQTLSATVDSGASLSYRGNPTNVVTKKEPYSGSITHLEK